MHESILRTASALAILLTSSAAIAGPPLSIDDPDILEPWQWELITAATVTSSDGVDFYQAPVVDISLGIIQDHVQVSAAYPYVYSDLDDGGSKWDFGNLEVGVKWRFIDTGGLQMAFAPTYAFGINRGAAEKGIGDGTDVTVFPVNAEYQMNDAWKLNGEVGYASVENGGDEWAYGAAVAYAFDDRWELLFELSGATDTDFDDDILDARAGFDFGFTESFHLLFSIATGLREFSGEDELDYDLFLGLQLFR